MFKSTGQLRKCFGPALLVVALVLSPINASAKATYIAVFPIAGPPELRVKAATVEKNVIDVLSKLNGYDALALPNSPPTRPAKAAHAAGAAIYVIGHIFRDDNGYRIVLESFDSTTGLAIGKYDVVTPTTALPAAPTLATLVNPNSVVATDANTPFSATPAPTATPCDTSAGFLPGEPEGHWNDDGPTTIVNTCECVASGIRVVGVHRGGLSATYNFIPAVYLQIFNLSGERRTIWADVEIRYPDGTGGWSQTPVWIARADERETYGLVDASPTLTANHGEVQVVRVNVLGCGT